MRFQLSVKIVFWGGVQNFPFLTTWPQTPKHYKNRGFGKPNNFQQQLTVTKRPFLNQKTQTRNYNYHFWGLFPSLAQQKAQKCAETPIFIL